MTRLAVLVSGKSSNLAAMIEAGLRIDFVAADRECLGREIAKKAGIEFKLYPRKLSRDFEPERPAYTRMVRDELVSRDIGLVAMAGWMTIFDPLIFDLFANKITNLHPSLLPAFPGDHAVRDALNAGVKVTGTTIHFATGKLDDGPIIAQEAVSVLTDDTVETLHERIKTVERRLYPKVVAELLQGSSV